MLAWIILLLFQLPVGRAILEAEDARTGDVGPMVQGLKASDVATQRLAVRALGRLERPANVPLVSPALSSADAGLRKEAANALAQMRAPASVLLSALARERDPEVRGVLYESIGRLPEASDEVLLKGLEDKALPAGVGAAKGLESWYRLNAKKLKPSTEAIAALRKAVQRNDSAEIRELALLTLNAAGDSDPATLGNALSDSNPLVRRLALMGSRQWRDDSSYLVRYEALRIAGSCDRAAAAVNDPSEHVALLAIDMLGNGCPSGLLERLADESKDWRRQARALVSLAKTNPSAARTRLQRLGRHPIWQARAYVANAARILKDTATLKLLLKDENPNVIAAALSDPQDALAVLGTRHYGLIMRATECLKGWSDGPKNVTPLLDALRRISAVHRATSRDPRHALMERLREFGGAALGKDLDWLLSDFDPAIAEFAAQIISEKTGQKVSAKVKRFVTAPVPPQPFIDGLKGAKAVFRMQEAGSFTLELLPEEAPVTVAAFARLAESGYYDNLTFHRIVPNFVIQGGSPGADEFDGAPDYLRDELGLLSHARGTVGISTRGRDTGDSQIFINLVDNFRLDHNYTVFARVIEGMENVDRIQEGDTIKSVQIIRR
jgi:cyclophilin family peptidyl-prolyl cis-trans isomerase